MVSCTVYNLDLPYNNGLNIFNVRYKNYFGEVESPGNVAKHYTGVGWDVVLVNDQHTVIPNLLCDFHHWK